MMYPFLTLDDRTEIVHSEMKEDGQVKVYMEKPDDKDCFHYATCWLPSYRWEDIYGFSEEEMEVYRKLVHENKSQIMRNSMQPQKFRL